VHKRVISIDQIASIFVKRRIPAEYLLSECLCLFHRLSEPSAARGISTRTWGRVDNKKVERRFAATGVLQGGKKRD
jgi:hypothetical protein